jgi:hypothetical protein
MSKFKTNIVIRVTDIKWDTDGEKVKLPTHIFYTPSLADIEDGLRNQDIDIEEVIGDYLSDKYGWCVESFEWCFA